MHADAPLAAGSGIQQRRLGEIREQTTGQQRRQGVVSCRLGRSATASSVSSESSLLLLSVAKSPQSHAKKHKTEKEEPSG